MNYAKKLLNNNYELILAVIFILFLISNNKDERLGEFVNKPEIKIYVIVVALLMFLFCNKLLGILALFVAYELLMLSHSLKNISITTNPIFTLFENKSMEEEMIYNMLPHSESPNYDFFVNAFENKLDFFNL